MKGRAHRTPGWLVPALAALALVLTSYAYSELSSPVESLRLAHERDVAMAAGPGWRYVYDAESHEADLAAAMAMRKRAAFIGLGVSAILMGLWTLDRQRATATATGSPSGAGPEPREASPSPPSPRATAAPPSNANSQPPGGQDEEGIGSSASGRPSTESQPGSNGFSPPRPPIVTPAPARITVDCPACGGHLKLPPTSKHLAVTCAHCQHRFDLPLGTQAEAGSPSEPLPLSSTPPSASPLPQKIAPIEHPQRGTGVSNPLLLVNRKELALAGHLLKKIVKPSTGLEVVLGFDGKELQIDAGGGTTSADAHGVWPGSARVASVGFLPILARLPRDEWIKCEVVDGVLKVGSLALPCVWRPGPLRPVWLPVNPRLADYVAVRVHCSDEVILGAGLWEKVEAATRERDRLIASAANTLEALGVTVDSLAAFVNEMVRRSFDPEKLSQRDD